MDIEPGMKSESSQIQEISMTDVDQVNGGVVSLIKAIVSYAAKNPTVRKVLFAEAATSELTGSTPQE